MKIFKVGLVGVTGYTGMELARLLASHPRMKLEMACSRTESGLRLGEFYPFLEGLPGSDVVISIFDAKEAARRCDLVFLAVPHGKAMEMAGELLEAGTRVIDLSADFRLRDVNVYEDWYVPHTRRELLPEAVYGLPELYAAETAKARLVANPGCYPSSAVLGLYAAFKHGLISPDNIVIDYEGKYCDEALREVAEKAGNRAEWWVEGQTVNVCRCETGEEVTLGYNKGLTGISCDMADNASFYTRLYPIGSSRNIDPEKYGHTRLQLPGGVKHVDVNVEKYGVWHRYEADAFADIYPKRIGTVSSVRSEEVTGEDGNPFKIFYFKDNSLGFDPNSYEIAEKVKRISFQEGSELAGLGDEEDGTYFFEANYDSDTHEFELITIWPYDDNTQLPNDTLCPKAGDKYILWNIRMPDEYYPLAEQEFREAVDRYNEENAVDAGRYKGPTDHVYIEENGIDLYVGRRVRLESAQYFPETGYRSSRITKITRQVNLPSQMDVEISDAVSTGTMEHIDGSIADAKNYVKTATAGSFPDLIRSWDNTYPTDNNVFSARRTLKESLSRLREDTAQEKLHFLKGADFGKYKAGESGAGVDGDGNAEWLTAVIRELLRSVRFVDGMFGEGWQLWMDALTGLSNLTIDKVTIRQTLVALELLIEKVRSVGGQLVVSAANGKIKTVTKDGENYKIAFEQENEFVAHDLMRCAEFTGASLRGYWVEVSEASSNGITVPVSEFEGVEPKAGDECVLMGNTQNRLRQNLISIAATEDGQPRVDVLDGVSAKNFNGCLRVRLGNLDGISDSRFPADNQPHGNGLYGDNVYLMGTFVLTTGEDILTRFEITEGKISSAVEGLRKDFTGDKSYLANSSFGDGMDKWETENNAVFFLIGGKWIWANDAPLADKTNYACVMTDDGRTAVYIQNRYILQRHEDFRFIPDYNDLNDEGQKKPEAVTPRLSVIRARISPERGFSVSGSSMSTSAGWRSSTALRSPRSLYVESHSTSSCTSKRTTALVIWQSGRSGSL